ncbi:hypothetical protein AMECASPLE_038445 [Ameca splendens]|uniref:Uncharacterized protein n=1 Tax=Ameca splendens TaxID=208324 RepID=A0ABV1A3L4_9TELE
MNHRGFSNIKCSNRNVCFNVLMCYISTYVTVKRISYQNRQNKQSTNATAKTESDAMRLAQSVAYHITNQSAIFQSFSTAASPSQGNTNTHGTNNNALLWTKVQMQARRRHAEQKQ